MLIHYRLIKIGVILIKTEKHYYNRQVIVQVTESDGTQYQFRGRQYHDTFSIHFNIPFSQSSTPSISTITIMNVSWQHRTLLTSGVPCQVFAGYKENTGPQLLVDGIINSVQPYATDGVDGTYTFTVQEGQDLAQSSLPGSDTLTKKTKTAKSSKSKKSKNDKYKIKKTSAIAFNKGVSTSTVIKRVANDAGIKIYKMKLVNDPTFRKGYTTHGKPSAIISSLVKASGSQMYYRRGNLIIDSGTAEDANNEHVYLSDHINGYHGGSGLIAIPTVTDDSSPMIEVKSLLLPQITANSLISVDSRYFQFTRPVKSGQHNCDDDDFSTTMEVALTNG